MDPADLSGLLHLSLRYFLPDLLDPADLSVLLHLSLRYFLPDPLVPAGRLGLLLPLLRYFLSDPAGLSRQSLLFHLAVLLHQQLLQVPSRPSDLLLLLDPLDRLLRQLL